MALAISRAAPGGTGALAVLDLGRDPDAAVAALSALVRSRARFGVRVPVGVSAGWVASILPADVAAIVVGTDGRALDLADLAAYAGRRVLVEVCSRDEAERAVALGAAGLIAKGSEAGGRVGDTSAFVLLQQLAGAVPVPVWLQGGIGVHTAGAARVGGATGVVLDAQLALVAECGLPAAIKSAIGAMDGSETRVVGGYRVYDRPDLPVDALAAGLPGVLGAGPLTERLVPAGQDAALAAALAKRYPRALELVRGMLREMDGHRGQARSTRVHAPGSPFARQHGLRYPILQGPMTRVSDTATFAEAVSENGGLPFLALSLLTGDTLRNLLDDTRDRLGDRPWGVGMLGFAPPELRAEQIEAVRRARPPVALLAGGRPAQARELEADGIPTYLHVPSPGLLELFLRDGARRFVLEGRECGGHVGPRTSFVLWEQFVERLVHHEAVSEVSVVFAGGIHDGRSAAMVSTLAAPLAVRGAKIGLLMGTAYLFTDEAVTKGAIGHAFQQAAVDCRETVLVHTAPGHATRCADTPFVDAFATTRARMEAEGAPPDAIWEALERLNLGRLRIAAKGIAREGDALVAVDEQAQRRDGMFMIGQVATLRHEVTTIAALHADVSLGADRFLAAAADPAPSPRPSAVPIAIVGMAGIFPGAPDLDTFWSNVVLGRDAVREVPPERWNASLYWDDAPTPAGKPGKTPSKWGGFLEPVAFDPLTYGIPPKSLAAIEPVQLLALEVARRALDDAGYGADGRPFDRERTSVVFGAEAGTDLASAYGMRAQLPQYLGEVPPALDAVLPTLTEDSFPGVLGNVIAGRIANRLDLGGVNYTVDAACASSLAALDVACKELVAGTSDVVLAGGADLHNAIGDFLLFGSVHALSPTGRSRPFAADADGIALGEGVGAIVCKRLDDAVRDGDRIYAVIDAMAGSSDGRSLGLTAPRAHGQMLALERAYERAGVDPTEVGLVEAHGTGTVVGDRTELLALTDLYTRAGAGPGQVTLGSVKSNVGHTKCAAGLAGLIKASLAIHHGVLPPSLHVSRPNPAWVADASPFVFRSRPAPWRVEAGRKRRAAVSAFGFGGTNFHVVLSSAPAAAGGAEPDATLADWPAELFLFRDLADIERLHGWLEACTNRRPRLAELSLAVARRGNGPVQVAIVASDIDDLRRKLEAARDGRSDRQVKRAAGGEPGKVAWLFPGQGSQRPGMLADLFVAFGDLPDRLLGPGWAARLFPGDAFNPADRRRQREALTDTRVAQPALGIVELGAAAILARAGLAPDHLAGHSYGELVALCVAGAIEETELVRLSEVRGDAILAAAGADPGTMAAVTAAADAVEPHLDGLGVVVSNRNSPVQTVIAGPNAGIDAAVARLEAAGFEVRRFPVGAAFHSPVVAGARDGLAAALAGFRISAPTAPNATVYANTTAAPYPTSAAAVRDLLAEHVVRPVRFLDEVEAMWADGARVFVEVGPGKVLTDLVRQTLGARPHTALSLDDGRGGSALEGLVHLLADLAVAGIEVDWAALVGSRVVDAPDLDAPAPSAPLSGWWVDGQRAWPIHGEAPAGAMRVVREPLAVAIGGAGGVRERVVTDYLRTLREQAEAQRNVMLAYLGVPLSAVDGAGLPSPSPWDPTPALAAAMPAIDVDAPAAPFGAVDPEQLLLRIVSERTGYPQEMLDLDLDLEADLSIDSIKRVEILGVLADGLGDGTAAGEGGRPDQEQLVEELAGVKTLRGILAWIAERTDAASASSADAPAGDAEPDAITDDTDEDPTRGVQRAKRFVPELEPLPRVVPGSVTLRIAVTGAEPPAGALFRSLARLGASVRLLGPTDAMSDVDVVIAVSEQAEANGSTGDRLYELADQARRAFGAGVQQLLVVTWQGGRLGEVVDLAAPGFGAGVSGLVKTIAKEFASARIRRIDLDPDAATDEVSGPEGWAHKLLAELADPDGPTEVGYHGEQRVGRRFTLQELDGAEPTALPWGALDEDAVVLLTGGARGITARVAVGIAQRYRCSLVLVGRSPAPPESEDPATAAATTEADLRAALVRARPDARGPSVLADIERQMRRILAEREMRETFAAIRLAGARLAYHAIDVRDNDAVRELLTEVYATHGRLDVALHGAGVNEDKLLRDKTRESFLRVFDTKVQGAHNLVQSLRPDTRAVVFFSSVAGAFGNRGQVDYAAANDALDQLARGLDGTIATRVVSIGWGPWGGGGMVTPELERQYNKRGIGVIDPDEGVQRLIDELAHGRDPHLVVMAALPHQLS